MTDLPKMSAPARRALDGAGYTSLEQPAKVSDADLLKLHGMCPKALIKIRQAIEALPRSC